MTEQASLELRNVFKSFQVDDVEIRAVEDVSFAVEPGEFVSVVGPSGCGKSTVLRLIAGLERPDEGAVLVDQTPVTGPSLRRGIVFQEHRLFPWLDVETNVGLGLLRSHLSKDERRDVARGLIGLVGLTGFETAFPEQLSGGMAQRAAIARSLAPHPQMLLLDEPLGALDSLTRSRMQAELLRIWQHEQVTMVMVTHDVTEAVFLSDRIVVMDKRPGRVREIVDVQLPKPRNRHDPAFTELSESIVTLLEENV
jgi:ABC-type nitrate/sulfonate/bicarbonate transport system ATPase subunit